MVVNRIEKLVDQFAEAATKRNEALVGGDSRRSRKYSVRVVEVWKKIRGFGDQGREALTRLLDHPHPSARTEAAAFLLRFKTEKAMAVLREAAQHEGLVAFAAQECIKRWEEGNWHLDE